MFAPNARRTAALIAAVALALTVTACGDDDDSDASPATTAQAAESATAEAPSGDAAPASLDALYAAAKDEGTVIWNTSIPPEDAQTLADAFSAKYPGIDVSIVTADGDTIPPRIVAEAQADRVSLDVATARTDNVGALVDRNLIETVDWKAYDPEIQDRQLQLDGRLVKMYDFVNGWAYNTDIVKPEDVPATWDDLLDPKWKGQLLVDAGGDLALGPLVNSGEWTEAQAEEFITSFVDQDPALASNGLVTATSIGAGEYAIGSFPLTVIPRMQAEGAPVAILPLGPVSASASSMFVPVGGPHPNAGKLLLAWLASPEGVDQWVALGRGLADECTASTLAQLLCDAKVKVIPLETEEQVATEVGLAEKGVAAMSGHDLPTVDE